MTSTPRPAPHVAVNAAEMAHLVTVGFYPSDIDGIAVAPSGDYAYEWDDWQNVHTRTTGIVVGQVETAGRPRLRVEHASTGAIVEILADLVWDAS